jgi:hypothetical protein
MFIGCTPVMLLELFYQVKGGNMNNEITTNTELDAKILDGMLLRLIARFERKNNVTVVDVELNNYQINNEYGTTTGITVKYKHN